MRKRLIAYWTHHPAARFWLSARALILLVRLSLYLQHRQFSLFVQPRKPSYASHRSGRTAGPCFARISRIARMRGIFFLKVYTKMEK